MENILKKTGARDEAGVLARIDQLEKDRDAAQAAEQEMKKAATAAKSATTKATNQLEVALSTQKDLEDSLATQAQEIEELKDKLAQKLVGGLDKKVLTAKATAVMNQERVDTVYVAKSDGNTFLHQNAAKNYSNNKYYIATKALDGKVHLKLAK